MPPPASEAPSRGRLPPVLVGAVLLVSMAPALLHLAGLDLGARPPAFADLVRLPENAALHQALRGAFMHTLLEAAAVGVAGMTVVLAWIHARSSVSVAPPLLALALLVAAIMDLFHIAVSDYLMRGVTGGPDLIPFTWAMSRILTGLALVAVGAALAVRSRWTEGGGRRLLYALAAAFVVAAAAACGYAVMADALPVSAGPGDHSRRPLELAALALYLVAAALFLRVGRGRGSLFVGTLGLSMVPAAAAQLHMAFGSTTLYDHDFMAAHVLKVASYAVPFLGLGLDYLRARAAEVSATARRVEAEVRERAAEDRADELARLTGELERRNRELDEFAYVASHDLRAPLRGIRNLATWVEEDVGRDGDDDVTENLRLLSDRVERMDALVEGLLRYSRVGRTDEEEEDVPLGELVDDVVDLLAPPDHVEVAWSDDLPSLWGERLQIQQVVQNLLGNALKYARSRVEVGARAEGGAWRVHVSDDGPGIPEEHRDRVWVIFKQVGGDGAPAEGTGIGLAIVKKIVERNGGEAWIETADLGGARFVFTWPRGAAARAYGPGGSRPAASPMGESPSSV